MGGGRDRESKKKRESERQRFVPTRNLFDKKKRGNGLLNQYAQKEFRQ